MAKAGNDQIRESVRKRYAGIAARGGSGCGCSTPSCCSTKAPSAETQSGKLGYSKKDVKSPPVLKPGGCGSRTRADRKIRVLFLCTGNSCRSQMAEGWARALKGDVIEPYSAGIETHGLNPLAVKVMAEAGVDISGQRSKTVEAVMGVDFDHVVTVCGHASETCPAWLRGKAPVTHAGFDDPPALARTARTDEEIIGHYRRVRDQIKSFVESLPGSLAGGKNRNAAHLPP